MDHGTNVNLKFYNDFAKGLFADAASKGLIDIGTCSLHTVHKAFRKAMNGTGWEIDNISKAFYRINDSPARKEDYTKLTRNRYFS